MRSKVEGKELLKHNEQVRAVCRLARRKVFAPEKIGKRASAEAEALEIEAVGMPSGDVEPNDTGLPPSAIEGSPYILRTLVQAWFLEHLQ